MAIEHTINEQARKLPVSGSYDLVIAGAGIAGISAALAAVRRGISVCLIEKTCAVGGLATLGNVTIWLPLCDGKGRQVIGGLGEELLKLIMEDLPHDYRPARFETIPTCWQQPADSADRRKKRYQASFNPASCMFALEKLLTETGIDLLYDTRLCAVERESDRIRYLIIENKNGRSAIACRTAIDATGDADLCYMAGEQTESLDTNVLCGWFYYLMNDKLHLRQMTNPYSRYAQREGAQPPFHRGDEARDVTQHLLGSREMISKHLAETRIKNPQHDVQIISYPTIPCFRMTRRLLVPSSLGEKQVHTWFDDAIGLTGDWRAAGPVYALPFRTIRAEANRNLLVAGRCISADTTVWDVTRAIPCCAVTGEAAGAAAAMAVKRTSGDTHEISIAELQKNLKDHGVILDSNLVQPIPDNQ